MRVPNRANTDALLAAVLVASTDPYGDWTYLEDVAPIAGLTMPQVERAVTHLVREYEALSLLPATRAVRLCEAGVRAYEQGARKFHESRLGEHERPAIVGQVSETGGRGL